MKSTELRIGNIIASKMSGVLTAQMIPIDIDMSRYEPIPLTEDWLLKFGFNYDDMEDTFEDYNPWYHLVYDGFRFSSDKSVNFESVFIQLNKKTIEIKHVHQLQNLYFALTGCELEIK